MVVTKRLVKNFMKGRKGYKPIGIVIHISEGTMPGTYAWFNNPDSKASSHYMVGKNGTIWQFVEEENTAWTNGPVNKPSWKLLKPGVSPNLYTVTIEHEGKTGEAWTSKMYEADTYLVNNICKKWGIPKDRNHIIGHYEIDSVNKRRCPGTGFDFNKLLKLVNQAEEDPAMIEELKRQIAQLEQRVSILNNNLKSQQQANSLLQEQMKALQQENQNLKERLSSSAPTNAGLEKKILDLEKEVAYYKDRYQRDVINKQGKLLSSYSTGELLSALGTKLFV